MTSARGFLISLQDAVESILEALQRWPERRFGCRIYPFPNRYPFSLVYRIASDSTIEVVAVTHSKRMPAYWRRR